MAPATSKYTNNLTPQARRGQIKIMVVKMIAKSLQNLAIGVAGKGVRSGGSGGGGLKSASECKIKQRGPKRGDVKIMMFKLIAESVRGFAIGVAGKEKKAAGNGGGNGGCFSSTTTVIPLETVGFKYEIKETQPLRGEIKIDDCRINFSGSRKNVCGGAWAGKKVGGSAWSGIVAMGLESEDDR